MYEFYEAEGAVVGAKHGSVSVQVNVPVVDGPPVIAAANVKVYTPAGKASALPAKKFSS